MKTAVIVQARMGSTRLPGKVMIPLAGKTVLGHIIGRLATCQKVDEIVVATTDLTQDDVIAAEASHHGAGVFRGSEQDVLDRYYQAAKLSGANTIVRVTSDCPLFDPALLDSMLAVFDTARAEGVHYLSNAIERSFPRGLDAEIFPYEVLAEIAELAQQPHEREHVTPFIYQHPERYQLRHFMRDGENLAHLRWTLDTPEDLRLIELLYESLYREGAPMFTSQDVLALLALRPELVKINAHIEQKKLEETS